MALMKCTECGHDVSSKAAACPHCGCPVSEMDFPEEDLLAAFGAEREQLRYDSSEDRVYVGDAPLEDGDVIDILVLNRYWLYAFARREEGGWVISFLETPDDDQHDWTRSIMFGLRADEGGRYAWGLIDGPKADVYARMPDSGHVPTEIRCRKREIERRVREMEKDKRRRARVSQSRG